MLEIGSKTDVIHDLALLELAIKFLQQQDTPLENILND